MLTAVSPDTTVPVPAWPPVGSPLEALLTRMTADLVIWFEVEGDAMKTFTSLTGHFYVPKNLDLSFAGLLPGAFADEEKFLHVLIGRRTEHDADVPTDKFGHMNFRVYIDWRDSILIVARDTRKRADAAGIPRS